MKWETFRDRLVPGGQEEWSLSVADAEGNPVRAAFLASMYDASLDKLFAHNWAFSLSFNRILPGTWPAMAGIRHQAYLHSSLPVKYPGRGFNLLGEEEYSRLYRSSLRSVLSVSDTDVQGTGRTRIGQCGRKRP